MYGYKHTSKNVYIISDTCCANWLSRISTSLEKRETIRPIGVVSVKERGALNTPFRSTLCKVRAATQQPRRGEKSVKNDVKPENN